MIITQITREFSVFYPKFNNDVSINEKKTKSWHVLD